MVNLTQNKDTTATILLQFTVTARLQEFLGWPTRQLKIKSYSYSTRNTVSLSAKEVKTKKRLSRGQGIPLSLQRPPDFKRFWAGRRGS
jgi:hypothetical protein